MIPSAVGAALSRSATQPDFAISGRRTSLSNEINPTELTNHLILDSSVGNLLLPDPSGWGTYRKPDFAGTSWKGDFSLY